MNTQFMVWKLQKGLFEWIKQYIHILLKKRSLKNFLKIFIHPWVCLLRSMQPTNTKALLSATFAVNGLSETVQDLLYELGIEPPSSGNHNLSTIATDNYSHQLAPQRQQFNQILILNLKNQWNLSEFVFIFEEEDQILLRKCFRNLIFDFFVF